jgi:hypothetical protein
MMVVSFSVLEGGLGSALSDLPQSLYLLSCYLRPLLWQNSSGLFLSQSSGHIYINVTKKDHFDELSYANTKL